MTIVQHRRNTHCNFPVLDAINCTVQILKSLQTLAEFGPENVRAPPVDFTCVTLITLNSSIDVGSRDITKSYKTWACLQRQDHDVTFLDIQPERCELARSISDRLI